MSGVLILIGDGKAKITFVGYDGDEGHRRSHALRESMARDGVPVAIEATAPAQERADKGTVSA